MRSIVASIFLFPVLLSGQSVLRLQPERPVAGASVNLRYQPSSTLATSSADSFVAEVLCMGPKPIVIDVALSSQQRAHTGSFNVPSDTRALFIRISSRDHVDDRNGNCWVSPVFNNSGGSVPGAFAHLASAYRTGELLGFRVSRDLKTALTNANHERTVHPDAPSGWTERWRIQMAENSGGSVERVRTELDSLLLSWSDRQSEVCELLPFLELTGQVSRADDLSNRWATRDPRGPVALRVAWRDASDEADPKDRLEKVERVLQDFAIGPDDAMLQLLAQTAIAAGEWDKADEYIHRMPRKEPMLLIGLAQRLLATKTTIDRAAVLAKESVNAARNYDPALKPALSSLRDYRRKRSREVPLALETYGDALRASGHMAFAAKIYAEALEAVNRTDTDIERKLRETKSEIAKHE